MRAAGRKVKNTLTDAEVNKQFKKFLAETAKPELPHPSPEGSGTVLSWDQQRENPVQLEEDTALEEFAAMVPGGDDLTELDPVGELVKQHRIPARLLADYFSILSTLSQDGDKAGDKSPVVVEWLRDNLTPDEFEHKYAHRGIR